MEIKDTHLSVFYFFWKIVLVGEFCTSRRSLSCSHTISMLRSRYLALRKNNLIISDFEVREREIREFSDFREKPYRPYYPYIPYYP